MAQRSSTLLCAMSTFHNFASFQGYCLCPGGRGEHTVRLGIPLSCPCSSTPALQSVLWGSTGARDRRYRAGSCPLCSPFQTWSTHNQPDAAQKPFARDMLCPSSKRSLQTVLPAVLLAGSEFLSKASSTFSLISTGV